MTHKNLVNDCRIGNVYDLSLYSKKRQFYPHIEPSQSKKIEFKKNFLSDKERVKKIQQQNNNYKQSSDW